MSTRDPTSYGISLRAMPRNLLNVAEYLLLRRGPLANNVFESAAFVKTAPGLQKPDVQLVFQPARRPGPSFPFPIGHGFAISPVGLYPRSRGRLTLASADPLAAPLIDPNLLAAPEDLQPLVARDAIDPPDLRVACIRALSSPGDCPGECRVSDADLVAYIRAAAYTVHHPVSTCRMGSDPSAVVDPLLRVVGLKHLRIADASVFPSIIGGNTNAAVVMIAEKAADMILGYPPPAPATLEDTGSTP